MFEISIFNALFSSTIGNITAEQLSPNSQFVITSPPKPSPHTRAPYHQHRLVEAGRNNTQLHFHWLKS
jgi:hypothetical protein